MLDRLSSGRDRGGKGQTLVLGLIAATLDCINLLAFTANDGLIALLLHVARF
jgi:hypothetical protein